MFCNLMDETLEWAHGATHFFPQRESLSGPGPPVYRGLNHHTLTHHARQDSSGQVIIPTQRPLPDNAQHSQETDILFPVEFEPTITILDLLQAHTFYTAPAQTFNVFLTVHHSIDQRFSNVFQVGTTFISQNVLRTTLLLGLSNSLGLP